LTTKVQIRNSDLLYDGGPVLAQTEQIRAFRTGPRALQGVISMGKKLYK